MRDALISWPALLVVLVGAILIHSYVGVLRGGRETVSQSQTVLVTAQSVQVTEDEAEAAERGFVLSGEASFITALQNALEALPANAARLRRLVDGDPAQSARAATLEAVVARRGEQMLHAVEVRRNVGPRAARDYVLRNDVRGTDRRMREVLGQIIAAENERLAGYNARLRARERTLLGIGLLTAVLAFGVRGAWRAVRRRRAAPPVTEPRVTEAALTA